MSEIQMIRFDGDNLQTVREGDRVWVVLKRACEALGLDPATQAEKLKEKAWACTGLIPARDTTGRMQEAFCVDLDTLPMWLATIDVGRVRPESREKLIAYQRECARVLRDHFFGRTQAVVIEANAQMVSAVAGMAQQVEHLSRQVAWLTQNIAQGGVIAPSKLRHMQREVKSIAALEAAGGRLKNARAASADIYRAMGEMADWGGKGRPWSELPAQMVPAAMSVLRRRRKDAESALCRRQLRLVSVATANA